MAEGHIVLPLSNLCVCVCMCVFVCVFPELCLTHNFLLLGGISKLFGTRREDDMLCARIHVARLKAKITLTTLMCVCYIVTYICVQPTILNCMVGFQNFSALIVITSLRVKVTLAT